MVLPTRQVGKLLCTKAGRPEIFFAALLGSLLGFAPGFLLLSDVLRGLMLTPVLVLGLVALALALRVHLGVFGLAVGLAKVLSVCLGPVRYWLGELFVDTLTPLFALLRDTPLVAWCGPAHYATVGGVLLGTAFGVALGQVSWRALQRLRQHMAALEEGSERYQKLSGKRTLRLLTWLLVGAALKQGRWTQLAEQELRRAPRPRLWGVGVAAVLIAGLAFVHSQLVSSQFQRTVQSALEESNGATVDLHEAELDLIGGRARLVELAIADPEALDTDLFRVARLELALDTGALLKRRFVVDEITAVEAETGARRATPGQLLAKPEPPPAPPAPQPKERSLEDWVTEAERWHGRLQQIAHWVGVIASHASDAGESDGAVDSAVAATDRVDSVEVETLGDAAVEAPAIAGRHPGVLIRKIRIDGIASSWLKAGDLLDLRASNVSSHPGRVAEPMELTLSARSGAFRIVLRREAGATGALTTEVQRNRMSVDETLAGLGLAHPPLRGGTMDVHLKGRLEQHAEHGVTLELPLKITARDTTLVLPGAPSAQLAELPVTLGLRGPLASPRLRLDDEALTRTLIEAGHQRLAALVEEQAQKLLADFAPASPLVEGLVSDPGAALLDAQKQAEDLREKAEEEAGRQAAAAAKKAEDEAKKRAAEEWKKRLPGGLDGLLPGKKRD